MKKSFFSVLLFALMVTTFSTSPVSAWNFDKMIAGVEKKLPIAEKQATIIVKMLNNDEHLAKIQGDIDKIRNNKPLKAKDAYLYRVLKKIDKGKIALEKSALCAKLIWTKGPSSYYTQPLYPLFLVSLAGGNYQNFWRNDISTNKDFLKNKEKADALVILCKKLMEIQKPVLFLAREKLNVDGIRNRGNGGTCNSGGAPKKLRKNRNAYNIYGFLFPARVAYNTVYYKAIMDEQEYLAAYPISYLKYLQSQAEFLKDLEFKTTLSSDWDRYIEELGKMLADKTGDLDDLTLEGKKETQSEAKDKDLNLDDLKLPK